MATTALRPIQTRYKGYHFRSRLEARWAVFFDELGLDWEYEPEGFDLGDLGLYLPDFRVWLPECGTGYFWVEVKPQKPKECGDDNANVSREVLLARRLAMATRAVVLFGTAETFQDIRIEYAKALEFEREYPEYRFYAKEMGWCCDQYFCTQYWDPPRVIDRENGSCVSIEVNPLYFMDLERMAHSASSALSARFEHGECGST
jgi:hypothetical protein